MDQRPDVELNELSRACRILELEGHGDFTLGHAALRDARGHGFWMKRNAAGLGENCGPDDSVLVDVAGNKLSGSAAAIPNGRSTARSCAAARRSTLRSTVIHSTAASCPASTTSCSLYSRGRLLRRGAAP